MSLKNQIGVASHLTNAGFVAWINNTSRDDAAIVKTFRKLGAVVFARTNQPQAGMHLETSNNIYGTTVNPRNRQLTAGGSTGGEAALMGMNASVLGIGGDIGGSIRIPAAFNGVSNKTPAVNASKILRTILTKKRSSTASCPRPVASAASELSSQRPATTPSPAL